MLAVLSGAQVGASVGGLTGALVGMGLPEHEAKRYEGKVRDGNILVSVLTGDSDQRSRVKDVFVRAGAEEISSTGSTAPQASALQASAGQA
jgi:hypothetical protein